MNTLYFLAGLGLGSFLTVIASLWLVGRVNKQSAERAKEYNEQTLKLLKDRNDFDFQKVKVLERIANSNERML